MHLPDGIVNNQISIGFMAVAVGFIIPSIIRLKQQLTKKILIQKNQLALADGPTAESTSNQKLILSKCGRDRVWQMAMIGALIFAMQMINFPVTNGTSGHLIGAVLAAVVLGPWAGLIAISAVLAVQSLIFADGGILALGANIFNMGIVASYGGWYFIKFLKSVKFPSAIAIIITAWFSVVVASFFCALQIGFSETASLSLIIPGMVKIHLLIGVGEAIITLITLKVLRLKFYED